MLSPRKSIFQYPMEDEIFKYVIHRVLENTQWIMNASLYKNDCYYPLADKSIGKYPSGWWQSLGKILNFLPRSLRLLGRKFNIFPQDYHHPLWYFPILFFSQRVIYQYFCQPMGNNNHFYIVMHSLSTDLSKNNSYFLI